MRVKNLQILLFDKGTKSESNARRFPSLLIFNSKFGEMTKKVRRLIPRSSWKQSRLRYVNYCSLGPAGKKCHKALAGALSSLDFWVGSSLRCQAVVSQPHGIHRLATVATPGRANHNEPSFPRRREPSHHSHSTGFPPARERLIGVARRTGDFSFLPSKCQPSIGQPSIGESVVDSHLILT